MNSFKFNAIIANTKFRQTSVTFQEQSTNQPIVIGCFVSFCSQKEIKIILHYITQNFQKQG